MAILKINGTAIPEPSSMSVLVQDVDNASTTRNAKGVMLRDRVRGGSDAVRKLECEWQGLTLSQASSLLSAIGGEFFSVTYSDTLTGAMRTCQMYVGDRTAKVYRCDEDGMIEYLESIKANFIEK